jgi:type IV pilus assembly protein PilV
MRNGKQPHWRPQRARGFSMLEVLVALLVLSVGLLGLAALQTMGLKFNTQSYQRTQAVLNAYDIIDRIRANPGGVLTGGYDDIGKDDAVPSLPTCPCSPAQMANYDIAQWKNSLTGVLTQGKGAVCRGALSADMSTCTVAPSSTKYQVGIEWMENDLTMRMMVEAQVL